MRRAKAISVCGWRWQREQDWKQFCSERPTSLEFYGMLLIVIGLLAFACLVIL